MNLKQTRDRIALSLTTALASRQVKVHAYRQQTPKPFHGWVEFDEVGQRDDHELQYGEVGLAVQVCIPIATDRSTFERTSDDMTLDLISACMAVGRGVIVRPFIEILGGTSLYSVSATFVTESGTA